MFEIFFTPSSIKSFSSSYFVISGRMTKKIILAGVSAMLLVAVVIGAVSGVMRSTNNFKISSQEKIKIHTVSRSIESICQITDYKEACLETLNAASPDNKTADPKTIVTASIKATFTEFSQAAGKSKEISTETMVLFYFIL